MALLLEERPSPKRQSQVRRRGRLGKTRNINCAARTSRTSLKKGRSRSESSYGVGRFTKHKCCILNACMCIHISILLPCVEFTLKAAACEAQACRPHADSAWSHRGPASAPRTSALLPPRCRLLTRGSSARHRSRAKGSGHAHILNVHCVCDQ